MPLTREMIIKIGKERALLGINLKDKIRNSDILKTGFEDIVTRMATNK